MENTMTMTQTKVKKTNRFFEGLKFLGYGFDAFGVIGFELLLAYVIEPMLYNNRPMNEYEPWMLILHWVITCAGWGLGAYYVARCCAKKTGFDLIEKAKNTGIFKNCEKISLVQWIMIVAGVVICLISTWIDWNGSKVLHEFAKRGPLLFTFQYIYYFFEVLLVLLIIVFGQMAMEKWTGNNKIPFGGILVGLTWGLGHWLTKGSLGMGIYTAFGGFVFGSVYVLTNRNPKLSYLLLCIMFIL
jgi:hypothetical protein